MNKMKKLWWTMFVLCFCCIGASAQKTIDVTGDIMDEYLNMPLKDVKISLLNPDSTVVVDSATTTYVTGKAVEKLLDAAHITCNKNTIPNDPQSPFVTSGIRLGTPAVTSRGMNTQDMDKIAEAIAMVIKGGQEKTAEARAIVQTLTDKYPLN